MKPFSTRRLLAISALGFSLTLLANVMHPTLFGHKILALAPPGRHNTLLGMTTFAGSLLSMFVLPLVGALSDRTQSRLGRRMPYFIIGVITTAISAYLIAGANTIVTFIIAGLLYYITSTVIEGPWTALFPDLIPSDQRGQASGYRALLDVAALIVGRQASSWLIAQVDVWGEIAVWLTATVPIISMVITLLITHNLLKQFPLPPQTQERFNLKETLAGAFSIDFKTYPAFAWWFANRFFFWGAFNILGTFLLFFTIDVIGLPQAEAQRYIGTLATIIGLGILFIAVPAGRLADRIGRKPLVIFSGILAAIGTIFVLVMRDLILIGVGGALIGVASGVFISANFALITDIVPAKEAARYMGLAGIASASGSALARLMGGIIVDPLNAWAGNSSTGYLVLYSVAVVFFLISTIAAYAIPIPKKNMAE